MPETLQENISEINFENEQTDTQSFDSKLTKTNKLLIIISSFVVLVIASGLIWFTTNKNKTKIESRPNDTKTGEESINQLISYSSSKLGIKLEYPNTLFLSEIETNFDKTFNTVMSGISLGMGEYTISFSKYKNTNLEDGKDLYLNQANSKTEDGYEYIQEYIDIIENQEQKDINQESLDTLKNKISSGEYNNFEKLTFKNLPALTGLMVTSYHEALTNNYLTHRIILVEVNDDLLVIKYPGDNDFQILDNLEISYDISQLKRIYSDGKPEEFSWEWTPFELEIPEGWEVIQKDYSLMAVIAKEDYKITIGYPLEGAICNFPDTEPIEGPSGNFAIQSEFDTEFGYVRLGKSISNYDDKKSHFSICQKEKSSQYWAVTIPIGFVGYTTPENPDLEIIEEMNDIVKSIKVEDMDEQTSESIHNQTTSWETYTNKNFVYTGSKYKSYSFKYPSSWEIKDTKFLTFNDSKNKPVKIIFNAGGHGGGNTNIERITKEERELPNGTVSISLYKDLDTNNVVGTYWFQGVINDLNQPVFGFEIVTLDYSSFDEFEDIFNQVIESVKLEK